MFWKNKVIKPEIFLYNSIDEINNMPIRFISATEKDHGDMEFRFHIEEYENDEKEYKDDHYLRGRAELISKARDCHADIQICMEAFEIKYLYEQLKLFYKCKVDKIEFGLVEPFFEFDLNRHKNGNISINGFIDDGYRCFGKLMIKFSFNITKKNLKENIDKIEVILNAIENLNKKNELPNLYKTC